jgi:hypothetical protein
MEAGKLHFLIKKISIFSSCNFFLQILVIKTLGADWIRIHIKPKMLDLNRVSMNPDPKHWEKPF